MFQYLPVIFLVLFPYPCNGMQQPKAMEASTKPAHSAMAAPVRSSNSAWILDDVPGLKLQTLCFLWLTKKFLALEPAARVQWLQNLAHMVPDNLVARLLGEYILNHSAMYDSYDFGPFCICWAEYFANKCIETQEAQIELQDQLDLDPGKASSLLQDWEMPS